MMNFLLVERNKIWSASLLCCPVDSYCLWKKTLIGKKGKCEPFIENLVPQSKNLYITERLYWWKKKKKMNMNQQKRPSRNSRKTIKVFTHSLHKLTSCKSIAMPLLTWINQVYDEVISNAANSIIHNRVLIYFRYLTI